MNTLLAHCTAPHDGLLAALAVLPFLLCARRQIVALGWRMRFALAYSLLLLGQWLEVTGTPRRDRAECREIQQRERAKFRNAWSGVL